MDMFSKAKGMFDVVTGGDITGQTGELIWKYPHNMITSGSILQVKPGQEAVFLKSGAGGFEVLGPGDYPVDTKLIPFLQKVMNIPFAKGKKTPYTTHIWYVNKTVQLDFQWGTKERVTLEDPKFANVMLQIGAGGVLWIEVVNSLLLFDKFVGTVPEFTMQDLENRLKTTVINEISGILQRYGTEMRRTEREKAAKRAADIQEARSKGEQFVDDGYEPKSFVDMLGDNDVLEQQILGEMQKIFELLGINVVRCSARLDVNKEDKNYQKINNFSADLFEAQKQAEMQVIAARGTRDSFSTLGTTYMDNRAMDVKETFAANEGSMATNMAGMGVGLGMMGVMAGQAQQYAPPPMQQPQQPAQPQAPGITCPSCGVSQSPAKFCSECGASMGKKCPSCGVSAASATQKFCNECGSSMEKKCPGCGEPAGDGQKFCNECGQKL